MVPLPTWRLAAVAAALAVAVLLSPGDPGVTFVVANGLLLAVFVVDWLLAPQPRRVEVMRELPDVIGLGSEATVTWRVRNPARYRLAVRLADTLAPSLLGGPDASGSRRARLVLPVRSRAAATTTLRPRRRGRFELHDVVVRVEGPLRLAARQGRQAVPATLRVYPRFASRKDAELRLQRRELETGLRTARTRGGGTEFDALREYTVDDEFRRIDWAATARATKPIVRTYREERNQNVVVLLDTGRTMAARIALDAAARGRSDDPLATVPRLDHAMDAAMALTLLATGLGDRAGLVAFADLVRAVVPPAGRRNQLGRVTEALYSLEPRLAESDYRAAFTEALVRFRRRAMFVVVTELAAEAVRQTLLPALPLATRRNVVVVAALRDPDVDVWSRAVPEQSGTAYRKAAAVDALRVRARTAAALRARGAIVLDEVPGTLAARLADTYLEVKAQGAL